MTHRDPIESLVRLTAEGGREAAVAERVRGEVEASWRSASRRHRMRGAARLLAALIPIVVAVTWLLSEPSDPVLARLDKVTGDVTVTRSSSTGGDETESVLGTGSEVATGPSGRASLALPGGGHLRVDAQTRLALLGEHYVELLSGAVYFDSGPVGPSGSTEVIVETPFARLRNVGTRYEARISGDRLEVGVRSGEVVIVRAGVDELVVPEGELVVLDADGQIERTELSAVDRRWDWTLGLTEPFSVEGRKLGEFLDWVERESGLRVRLATDAVVRDTVLRGDLVWSEPRSAIGPTLRLCGLSGTLVDDAIVIEDLDADR